MASNVKEGKAITIEIAHARILPRLADIVARDIGTRCPAEPNQAFLPNASIA